MNEIFNILYYLHVFEFFLILNMYHNVISLKIILMNLIFNVL